MRKYAIKIGGIVIIIIGIILTQFMMNENIAQFINMFCIIAIGVWILIKGLEIPEISTLVSLGGMTLATTLIKVIAESTFAQYIKKLYNFIVKYLCDIVGIETSYQISAEIGVTLTFWIIFFLLSFVRLKKDQTAMKIKKSDKEEFRQKSYAQKSENFCKTLRQRLEVINRETDWNESLFTPIHAEVEVCIKGKRKKKYEDLVKCLKSVRYKKAIFLVLGDPGAGKSVALRKLCLELLDEAKQTKKIPVYINLKKWNGEWNLDNLPRKKDLIDFIKLVLYENGDIFTDNYLDTYFDKMLEDGRWYFVFDSFDEMPCLMGKQNCQELIDKISELLYQFLNGANQNGGIIASRLYKAPSEAIGATVTLKLQEFNDIKIKTMLQKYLSNSEIVVKELFGKRENLVVLCRNPFYLTLLITFIQNNGMIFPENQMELYKSFIEGRLKKCSGKFQSENVSMSEIHEAAKKLAVFMQESVTYGLECPTIELFSGQNGEYWKKSLKLLEYAKICRLGGVEETVSFVHRRFQEFFLVENIIESKQMIGIEEYESIMKNSGLRDALVLYCEVADQEKTEEIASFCWKIIEKNKDSTSNVLENESIELINVLYFMAQAFRNRKDSIKAFKEEFSKFVEERLNKDTDFVILCALVNSIVLFERESLQKIILKVFQLKNRWLNDIIMQNCRIISRLSYDIEKQFIAYFMQMDMRTLFKRFSNTQFSLSLSRSFQYVRIVHFLTFMIEMIYVLIAIIIGVAALFQIEKYYHLIVQIGNEFNRTELDISAIWNLNLPTTFDIDIKAYLALCFPMVVATVMAVFLKDILKSIRQLHSILMIEILLCAFVVFPVEKGLGNALVMILGLTIVSLCTLLIVHDVYGIIKDKSIRKYWKDKKNLSKNLVSQLLLLFLFGLIAIKFISIVLAVYLIIIVIALIILLFSGIKFLINCYEDWSWLRKQPNVRKVSREQLAGNLEQLKLKKSRRKYIDDLLQRKVELVGEWSGDRRPQYNDDKLELCLARLDCAKIVTYNYLF